MFAGVDIGRKSWRSGLIALFDDGGVAGDQVGTGFGVELFGDDASGSHDNVMIAESVMAETMRYTGNAIESVGRSEAMMQSTFEIQQRVQVLLARLPAQSLEGLLFLLETLVPKEEDEIQTSTKTIAARYDFSDLTGRLSWRGDVVEVQRALRDEW
jgi:hypothetical protein